MLMRQKPLRGEKHALEDGTMVTIIEALGKDPVKVLTPEGLLRSVSKRQIKLQMFDTQFFEKVPNVELKT